RLRLRAGGQQPVRQDSAALLQLRLEQYGPDHLRRPRPLLLREGDLQDVTGPILRRAARREGCIRDPVFAAVSGSWWKGSWSLPTPAIARNAGGSPAMFSRPPTCAGTPCASRARRM